MAGALADHTSGPRDLDVLVSGWAASIAALEPGERLALEPVRDVLSTMQQQAHAALTAAMDEAGRDAWIQRWRELVDTRRAPDGTSARQAKRSAGRLIADRLDRAHRRLIRDGRRITPESADELLHDLRKDAKRLRYLLECFAAPVDATHLRRYVKRLKALQDQLGALQDLAVHEATLDTAARLLAAHPGDTTHPDQTMHAVAALVRTLGDQRTQCRAQFEREFASFDSAPTRRALEAVLADLRG
jgi:CHAD domain-containing protein